MAVQILWTVRDWAEAIARQPVTGPLPRRTALVPNGRAAHVLRRELVRTNSSALAGTRILPTVSAAVEVLLESGMTFSVGERALRRARLAALLRSPIVLRHFPAELLRDRAGWDQTLAATIGDLEDAGLRPDDLTISSPNDRLLDLAAVWRALDESAGSSWTEARVMLEAARVLERAPDAWPFAGTTVAFVGAGVTAAGARLLQAIPEVTLGLAGVRPLRQSYVDRTRVLLGDEAAGAAASATAPRLVGSECDLLASFFFEPPSILAGPARPRSEGPDGTFALEEHAGVEAEVEAAVGWVAQMIAEGVALEEIAVLTAQPDPLTQLLVERLTELAWSGSTLPVHIENGLQVTGTTAGARTLSVVRSLAAHLAAPTLANVIPVLRADGGSRHLSRGAAMDLAWSLGTVGGNAAHPAGALDWDSRVTAREAGLVAEIGAAGPSDGSDSGTARSARRAERLLADLRSIRPAIAGLVQVARLLLEDVDLDVLWPAVRRFLRTHVLQPPAGFDLVALLDQRLTPLASDRACRTLKGFDALSIIEESLSSLRVGHGRMGDPAVYVGTVSGTMGLNFAAVRILGLSEGHLPSNVREDPALPDRARKTFADASLLGAGLATVDDHALAQLHTLDWVVRNTSRCIALSTSRLDAKRSEREPSSVVLEAAAAVGRPNSVTSEVGDAIPNRTALQRDYFAPARADGSRFRREHPLGEAAWQDGVSRREFSPPSAWFGRTSLDLDRLQQLVNTGTAGAHDGLLGVEGVVAAVPGLTTERPVSPSRLEALLNCPHAFLLEQVLGFGEPAAPPPLREIGQPYYGSLVHEVVAEIYRTCGAPFCAGEGELPQWLAQATVITSRVFDAFLGQYPLAGHAVRSQQHDRLRRDVLDFVTYDWALSSPTRRFGASEQAFGVESPVELRLPSGNVVFVRGRIDRIDSDGHTALVRDLKTGRAHLRVGQEAGPNATVDLQIAVYGLVARAHSQEWQLPSRIGAAYVYLNRGRSDERSYRDDFHQQLEPAAHAWLDLAVGLLGSRLFPRTPRKSDCDYCAFQPVCGPAAIDRSTAQLRAAVGDGLANFSADSNRVLRTFAELKDLATSTSEED